MEKLLSMLMNRNIYVSIATVIIGVFLYIIARRTTSKFLEKNKNNQKINRKKKTYIKLFKNIFKYIIIIVVCVIILQVNGINVTSIIAGLGLVSVIAGLALQDALKDIIMGFNIIIDDYFSVGDVLKINDIEGKVIELGLKATKMKDVNNGNIYVVANRNISEALNLSNQLDIDIPLPYEEKVEKIESIIDNITNQISELQDVIDVEYKGLNEFGDSAIYYKIRIYSKPEFKPQVKRDANRIIKLELDKNNIQIPYMQVDVHKK